MKIGQLAAAAGVSIDTVRYYERNGVIPAPERMPSGYRNYGAGDLDRLRFVRRAKQLGFNLQETRQLLALAGSEDDMSKVKAAAAEKLRELDQRITELELVRDGLRRLVEACPGRGALVGCPILGSLSAGDAT